MGSSPAKRVWFVLILSFFCIALFAPNRAQLASPPVLLTKANSTRGVAVESTTLVAEPFAAHAPVPFSPDDRTRVMLFAANLTLLPGEGVANVSASAEDVNQASSVAPPALRRRRKCLGATRRTASSNKRR